jgi:uncharacterized membrane protein
VSPIGLAASAAGGALIGIVCAFGLPFCPTQDLLQQRVVMISWSAAMGLIGSIVPSLRCVDSFQVDSILGALFQATPYSKVQKKVVELPGGQQARTSKDILNVGGWDVLDNNQVFGPISMVNW